MRFWKEEEQWKKWLHHSAAMIGGYFGAYLVLTRAGIFGNAQTLNLISLVLAICGANIYEVMLRLGVLILYVSGTALYVIVTEKKLCNEIALSLFLDAVALVILGCMPQHIDVIWTMYPIAFALSFQWNAFPGAYSYISSTIFSTNNTKQTTLAFTRYFLYKDPELLCIIIQLLKEPFNLGISVRNILVMYHLQNRINEFKQMIMLPI